MINGEILHILIVDDNQADSRLIQETIPETERMSFQFESVSRLSKALARLKNGGIDLVLLDLELPDSQGLETFRMLSEATSHIPVIILTGNDDEAVALAAVRQGAQDYLIKGQVGENVLMRAVRYAVERKRVEHALVMAAQEWRVTFDSANDVIWLLDQDERVLRSNKTAERFFHRPLREMIGKKCSEIVHGTTVPIPGCPVLRSRESLRRETIELKIGERWMQVIADPILDAAGRYSGAVHILSDITEQKHAEEKIRASLQEKETMLQEIHHRVKNNLQVISSLLNMQSSHVQDEKCREIILDCRNRVITMAMIHTQLYQSHNLDRIDFSLFIRDLVGNIRQSYGRAENPVEIKVDADMICLAIDTSIPCGLILNELVCNALKYAFPEGKGGTITITMRSEDNRVALTVGDNGIGFPGSIDITKVKSLGLELVNILVRQMGGKKDLQVDGGTTWTISFPLKNERNWQNR